MSRETSRSGTSPVSTITRRAGTSSARVEHRQARSMAVIESTTFRPTAGVDARALLAADAAAVAGFWSGRPGFDPASRTLTVAADGTWTTRVRWDSLAEAEAAHADAAGAAPVADLEALTDAGTRTRTLDVEVPPVDGVPANWVTMDLFDTDADRRIVEHWDVIAALQPEPIPAGCTQVDGATEITDLHLTEA